MNKKIKLTMILAAIFAGGLAAGVAAYNVLSSRVEPENTTNVYAQGETVSVPGASGSSEVDSEPKKGKKNAHDFTMLDQNKKEVSLSDHYGKPIVLNFWASWCPPCRSEMPSFDRLNRERGDDVNVMMVNLTDGFRETTDAAVSYMEENGYDLPVFFDSKSEGARAYGIMSIPTTVFIYSDGTIMETYMGALNEDSLNKYVDAMLEMETIIPNTVEASAEKHLPDVIDQR